MESAVWGFIGTLIGATASVLTTYLTHRNAATLQMDARSTERIEKARAFQRETLLELQNAFHDAVRLLSLAHIEDVKADVDGSKWGKNMLPESLAEDIRLSNRRVMLFVERVADDSVRTTIKKVMAEANGVPYCSSRAESEALLDRVTFSSVDAIEQIGKTLRALY